MRSLWRRPGSLGTIPDNHEVAISTASLRNMVVDTIAQGQACINFLPTQNIDSVSFLDLEKLSINHINGRVQTPENNSWLYDFIKPQDPHVL